MSCTNRDRALFWKTNWRGLWLLQVLKSSLFSTASCYKYLSMHFTFWRNRFCGDSSGLSLNKGWRRVRGINASVAVCLNSWLHCPQSIYEVGHFTVGMVLWTLSAGVCPRYTSLVENITVSELNGWGTRSLWNSQAKQNGQNLQLITSVQNCLKEKGGGVIFQVEKVATHFILRSDRNGICRII